MSAVRINGKEMAAEVRAALTKEVEELKKKGITPGMATVFIPNSRHVLIIRTAISPRLAIRILLNKIYLLFGFPSEYSYI